MTTLTTRLALVLTLALAQFCHSQVSIPSDVAIYDSNGNIVASSDIVVGGDYYLFQQADGEVSWGVDESWSGSGGLIAFSPSDDNQSVSSSVIAPFARLSFSENGSTDGESLKVLPKNKVKKIDAHQLKEDFVGKADVSKFDIYWDTDETDPDKRKIILVKKSDTTVTVDTGLTWEEVCEDYPKDD